MVHTERFATHSRAHNIDDRVYSADFVEMHLLNINRVDGSFDLTQLLKRGSALLFHTIRKRSRIDDFQDGGK